MVERLEKRHLHYPIILITSGTAQDLPEVAAHPDIRSVLEKLLQDDALLDCIRGVLAAPPAVLRRGPGRMMRIVAACDTGSL